MLILAGFLISYLVNQNRKLTIKYQNSVENIKAYDAQLGLMGDKSRVFKLTIDQLNYFKDSVVIKMREVQKELGIKDKRLQQLQYELSQAQRQDTVVLQDTIFRNAGFRLDTLIGDKWLSTRLLLEYPGTIVLSPEVQLERFVFIKGSKETVEPPKKFFLFRWFQKRHITVEVNVKENNPYVINKEQKFIQIIK